MSEKKDTKAPGPKVTKQTEPKATEPVKTVPKRTVRTGGGFIH